MNVAPHSSQHVAQGGYGWHVEHWSRPAEASVHDNADRRPTALLLHGTGASTHSWTNIAPFLFEHIDLVAIDLPGHGRTGTRADADLSLTGVARAIDSLMNTLDISPDWAIGHSAGAAIACQLHLRETLRFERIISINGALLPLGGMAGWLFSPLARLGASTSWLPRLFAYRAGDPRQVRRLLESTGSRIDPASLAGYEKLFRDPQHVAGVLRMMASWHLESLQPRLTGLGIPVHLIAGANDRTIPLRHSRQLERLLPDAQLSIVDRVGHLAHEEAASAIARLIIRESPLGRDHDDTTRQACASTPSASSQAFTSTLGTVSP